MRIFKITIISLIAIFILNSFFICICWADNEGLEEYYDEKTKEQDHVTIRAKVIDITFDDTNIDKPNIPIESDIRYQHLKIKILNGEHKGETYTVRNTVEMIMPNKLIFEKSNNILLRLTEDDYGKVVNLKIYERSREGKLYFIIGLFMFLLIAIGGFKGFKSVITIIFTISLIFFVLLPLIIKGYNPILISVSISILAVIFTLTVISGFNKKTMTAILGTIAGVAIAGILALVVGKSAYLTGLGSENAQMLAYIPQHKNIDFKGLLFGCIILGALGAIMDISMSVSSAMWEIKEVQPKIKTKDLIKSGMNIGKDVMGSMSNTLILAYVSTSIHLLLLFLIFNLTFIEIINLDLIASEIIRAMAGSIGLICAVPLTVIIAANFAKKL